MGKRIKYGDPRKIDYGFDILNSELLDAAILERESQYDLYDMYTMNMPRVGDVVNVKYVGNTDSDIIFDGGFKDYIRVDNKLNEYKYLKDTYIGNFIDVYISSINDNNFLIKGSVANIYEDKVREILTDQNVPVSVMCDIIEYTPAGYNVELTYDNITLNGFMPNTLAGINKLHDPMSIVGQSFEVMVESYSKDKGTYIVSRKKHLQSLITQSIKELEYGKVYTGHVTGSTDFGVFVEFNECLTGMIHKTNIDPAWSNKLTQITPGYQINFYIKEIINGKIILTQILRESIWDTICVNQIINGRVKDNKSFGMLISLDDEANGLISTEELENSNKKLKIGDYVNVKVVAIDRSSRKIKLIIV